MNKRNKPITTPKKLQMAKKLIEDFSERHCHCNGFLTCFYCDLKSDFYEIYFGGKPELIPVIKELK